MPGPQGADPPLTSLVLPAYNPGLFLDRTCRALDRFLRDATDAWEILFVCDGCTDGTPDHLQNWFRDEPQRVRVLAYAPNRGKGHAVRCGLLQARGRWRLFTDVDLAYSFEDVARVAPILREGAEVAIASRLHPQSQVVLPPRLQGYAYRRHLQSLVFSRLVRFLLPLTQRDTQAGLKGMSAHAARMILPRLRCEGFGFDCELLTACARLGVPVTEVPVCQRYADTLSTTGGRAVARMVRELWQVRRHWRRGGPPATVAASVDRRQAA